MDTQPVGAFLLLFALLGLGGLMVYAAVAAIWTRLYGPEPEHWTPGRTVRIDLYSGCRTCEGASVVSTAALMRHQRIDHEAEGGIRW